MRSSVVILNALSEASGAIIIPIAGAINPPLIDTSSPIIVRDDSSDPSVTPFEGFEEFELEVDDTLPAWLP